MIFFYHPMPLTHNSQTGQTGYIQFNCLHVKYFYGSCLPLTHKYNFFIIHLEKNG